MICDKCHSIMTEIYYTNSIYFFCGNSKECEGVGIEISFTDVRIGVADNDYDEPMEDW